MKVSFVLSENSFLKAAQFRMEEEGDLIVPVEEAELILTEDDRTIKKAGQRLVSFGLKIPNIALEAGGFQLAPDNSLIDHFFSRWCGSEGWHNQILLGVPLPTLMDGDLGPPVEMGLATTFIESSRVAALFENPVIERVMKELSHTGFVSFRMSQTGAIGVQTGLPSLGIFNILEGVKGSLSQWFAQPESVLKSWVCSSIVARWPYPAQNEAERVEVNVPFLVEKHFYRIQSSLVKRGYQTTKTLLGAVTAWHQSLKEATWRMYRSLTNLVIPQKIYRMDLLERAGEVSGRLMREGMI